MSSKSPENRNVEGVRPYSAPAGGWGALQAEPHQPTIQETARRRRQLRLSRLRTAAPGFELEALSHGRAGRKEHVRFRAYSNSPGVNVVAAAALFAHGAK
jgi:hypothetical protein